MLFMTATMAILVRVAEKEWEEVVEDIWDDERYTEEIVNHYKKAEHNEKYLINVYKVEKELYEINQNYP